MEERLLFEFPNRTVLRVVGEGNVVSFIERHDEDAEGAPERWFLPSADQEAWPQIAARLQAAVSWTPVTPSLAVLDVMRGLRGDFSLRLAEAELAESGFERHRLTQVALHAEGAAQRLAMAAGLPPVNWSMSAPTLDAPTEVLAPVEAEVPEPAPAVDVLLYTRDEVAAMVDREPADWAAVRRAWSQLMASVVKLVRGYRLPVRREPKALVSAE